MKDICVSCGLSNEFEHEHRFCKKCDTILFPDEEIICISCEDTVEKAIVEAEARVDYGL